ncbi:MAG: nitrous oxide reductase accessory protein NosL [Deltaproteobacteria bacterium]|nr:nitrous oxide reductase accessory protein NosL [Deltaproteobacteria bacterium]
MKKLALGLLLLAFSTASWAQLADLKPHRPANRDKCPVCGMFVYKYPDWTAQLVFPDGNRLYFDGVKDLMKFYLNPAQYKFTKARPETAAVYMTDYYALESIEGTRAFYVLGSDVFGPMGKELIPFAREEEAREFMKDHKGKKILRFREITPEILKALD